MCKVTIFTWSCGCPTLGDIAPCESVKFCLNTDIDGPEEECKLWTDIWKYTPTLRVLTDPGMPSHCPNPCVFTEES